MVSRALVSGLILVTTQLQGCAEVIGAFIQAANSELVETKAHGQCGEDCRPPSPPPEGEMKPRPDCSVSSSQSRPTTATSQSAADLPPYLLSDECLANQLPAQETSR